MPAEARRRSKRPDDRPARDRYWKTRKLRTNKVSRIVRSSGLSVEEAQRLWDSQRKGRMRSTIRVQGGTGHGEERGRGKPR